MNTQTEITQAGLDAHAAAAAYKKALNFKTFKAGSGYGYKPKKEMYDIQGDLVYEGEIKAIQLLSSNTVKLTLTIPSGIPVQGVAQIGEIAVFLETGEMFAIGVSDHLIPKSGGWSLEHDFVVTYGELGLTVNLNSVEATELPASTMDTLPAAGPEESSGTTWNVLDGQKNVLDNGSASPVMAVRYAIGGHGWSWSFQGFACVYTGTPAAVVSEMQGIEMYPPLNGFWLNDGEQVIVCTALEAKRMVYNDRLRNFTSLDGAFDVLSSSTAIRIWRQNSNENALPNRKGVPSYYTLSAGLDTWTTGTNKATSTLQIKSFEFLSDGLQRVFPLGFSVDETTQIIVFQHGVPFDPDQYNADQNLVFMTPPAAGVIEGYAFYYVGSEGSETRLSEYMFTTDGTQDLFTLGQVVPDYDHLMAFHNSRLLTRAEMLIEGTTIRTNFFPRGTMAFVVISSTPKAGTRTTMTRFSTRADGTTRTYMAPISIGNRQQTLVFVGNLYQTKNVYEINGQNLEFDYVPLEGQNIEVLAFDNFEVETEEQQATGLNTGPQWRDPAGWLTDPCYLDVFQHDQTTFNGQKQFSLPQGIRAVNSKYLWFFLGGIYQRPDTWELSDDGRVVNKILGVSAGMVATMIVWVPLNGIGYSTDIKIVPVPVSQLSSGSVDLQEVPQSNLDRGLMAFAGGLLQDKASFQVSGSRVQWANVPAFADYQFLVMTHVQEDNISSEPLRATYGTSGRTVYPVTVRSRKGNTFPFVGGLYQYADEWVLNDMQVTMSDSPPLDTQVDLALVYTGLPRTRLVSREELEADYLRRSGGTVTGDVISDFNGMQPGTLVRKDYVDGLIQQLRIDLLGRQ